MKKLAVAIALLASPALWAGTVTLNFDDINTTSTKAIPSSYHTFTFGSNWDALNNNYYDFSDSNTVTFPSQPNVAFNGNGVNSVTLSNATPMQLTSLDAAWWAIHDVFSSGISSTSLTVEAFMNNTMVGSKTVNLATNFSLFNLNLPMANSWDFINSGGAAWWLVDDVTFTSGTSTTPEPASFGLLGVAGLGLLAIRRKFRA